MIETDIISSNNILQHLSCPENFSIQVLDSTASTNTLLKEKACLGAAEGTVIIAKKQTAGRGRLTRSFCSPKEGLYLSLLLRPAFEGIDAVLLTSAAAVAVCEAIEKLTDKKPVIKWVNDILINNKKVCGILTEGCFNTKINAFDYIVVGIGVNISPPKGGFADEIKDIAGTVLPSPTEGFKNRFAAEILNGFFAYYSKIESRLHINPYKKRSAVLGKKITVLKETPIQACALDIDESCRLLVEYPNGEREYLSSGEISIKL